MFAKQKRNLTAIDASAFETASVLVEASRTLRWVGIHAYGHALRSWEVLRTSPTCRSVRDAAQPEMAAVLQELDEDDGKKVLATEGMVEVEPSFVLL